MFSDMTQIREGRYSLRKESGGVYHYAIVSVNVGETKDGPKVEFRGDELAWLKDTYGPEAFGWDCCAEFREGALRGAKYALANSAGVDSLDKVLLRIIMIHGGLAHTRADDVAYATSYATWDALGVVGENHPDFAGSEIVFPNEGRTEQALGADSP
jgi:hypothetical protein